MIRRRSLLGLAAGLIAMPALVHADRVMPVSAQRERILKPIPRQQPTGWEFTARNEWGEEMKFTLASHDLRVGEGIMVSGGPVPPDQGFFVITAIAPAKWARISGVVIA